MRKLLKHCRQGDFHYFELNGEKDDYKLSVIKVPIGIEGDGWGGETGYYKVIKERSGQPCMSYNFVKSYFNGENVDYMPRRLSIQESQAHDFMQCVKEFVYPAI